MLQAAGVSRMYCFQFGVQGLAGLFVWFRGGKGWRGFVFRASRVRARRACWPSEAAWA